MKTIIITLLIAFFAYEASACSCSKYPIDPTDHMQSFAINKWGPEAEILDENTTWLRYYPTIMDRYMMGDMRGTSCEGSGPNGEPMFHCTNRDKSDYRIKFPKLNCEVEIRVTSTYSKVKVKTLKSSCPSL